jgi:hypothetical protein
MKDALSRWTILLLAASIIGCSGVPTRPETIGRGDYDKVAEYISALIRGFGRGMGEKRLPRFERMAGRGYRYLEMSPGRMFSR